MKPTPPEGYRIVEPEEVVPGLLYRYKDRRHNDSWDTWPNQSIRRYDLEVFHFAAPSHPAPSEAGQWTLETALAQCLRQWYNHAPDDLQTELHLEARTYREIADFLAAWNRRPAAQPTPKGTAEVLREAVNTVEIAVLMVRNEITCCEIAQRSPNAWPDMLDGRVSGGGLTQTLTNLRALLARLESEGE
jgi:hypothetical protein